MIEYHKIQTMFKREAEKPCRIIEGQWSLPEFEYLKDNKWIFTEKVDGTNIRVMWNGEKLELKFGAKTDNSSIPVFLYDRLNEIFKPDMFSGYETMCLYGEGYGAKIQKGGGNYRADGVDFVLFDVLVGSWWLQRPDVEDVASKFLLRTVPIIGEGTLGDAINKVKQGFNSQWGNFMAEGIVARPATELKSRSGDRIITKIKYKDFLETRKGK